MPATYTDRIDGLTTSVAFKAPVRAATTTALAWPLTGLQTINGIAVIENDRVLVKDQTDTTQNGIWLASSTAWHRALDWDGARDGVKGTLVHQAGSASSWEAVCADNPIVIGTSHVTFDAVFSSTGDGTDDDLTYAADVTNVTVPAGKGYVGVDCSTASRKITYDASNTALRKEVTIQKLNSETNVLTINDGASDVYAEMTTQRVRWRRSNSTVIEIARSK